MSIVSRTHFLRLFSKLKRTWLQKRAPNDNFVQLNINNTFILPSSFGWACLGIVLCLFVLGTNFQNNVILLLCFFLLAMLLLAVFHSFFYFTQHQIHFLDITGDYENRQLFLPITLVSKQRYQGGSFLFSIDDKQMALLPSQATTNCKLPLPHYTRGHYRCPTVTIKALYGFGLFKCWSTVSPKLDFYVYPKVQKSAINLFSASADAKLSHSSDTQMVISDDLQGIREYQQGDPMHHVSWKHLAKGQGMLTKDFMESKGVSGWLRLRDVQHLGIEQALRCLCYQIQQLDREQVQFGLDLGNTKILPHEGPAHVRDCLIQLALYQENDAIAPQANGDFANA